MMPDDTQNILTHPAVVRVRDALVAAGLADTVSALPQSVHTAKAAADVLGCSVGEIAKSIVFRAADARAVLVIASGANRVDSRKVAALIAQSIGKADADFVRTRTGFVIGGVAPFAHREMPITLMDEALLQYTSVHPAGGHPNAMFRITPMDLARVAGARIADIAE